VSQELELARARAKAKLKLRQKQLSMTHTEPVVEEPVQEVTEIPTGLEAGLRGAQQAITLEFGDEINAAAATAVDYISGDTFESLEDISNNYNKRLTESREDFALAKQWQPESYEKGTYAGTAASLLIPGGAVAKTAGMGAKMIAGAKIGAAFGATGALGASEDKMSLEGALNTIEGAVVGGVTGAVMAPVGAGLGRLGKKIQESLPEGMKDRLVNKALRGIGLRTEAQKTKFATNLQKKGVDPYEWVQRIAKEKDVKGRPLVGNLKESYKSISRKTEEKISQYAQERDSLLNAAGVKMDRKQVALRIKSNLVNEGISPSEVEMVNKILDENVLLKPGMVKHKELGETMGMIPDDSPLSAVDVSQIRKNIDGLINFQSSSNAAKIQKTVRTSLNDYVDELVSSSLDPQSATVAKELRHKMSDLFSLKESLQGGINHVKYGDKAVFKDTAHGVQMQVLTGPLGENVKAVAGALGIAYRKLSMSPTINRNLAFNASRLSEALPNAAEKSVRRLVALSDADDPSEFNIAAAGIVARDDLMKSPIPRTAEGVLAKKDSIMAVANDLDRDIAAQLQKAFDEQDTGTVLTILDTMSKRKEAAPYFHPGIGFDGKVYTQEDKATLELQLKQSDLPAAQSFTKNITQMFASIEPN
jgi:hypothetical protein